MYYQYGQRERIPPSPPSTQINPQITHGNHPRSIRLARVFQCLAVPRQPLKLLETLEIRVLKRLASAVQLRPWPPHFQSLSTNPHGVETHSERGFCDHSVTKQKSKPRAFGRMLASDIGSPGCLTHFRLHTTGYGEPKTSRHSKRSQGPLLAPGQDRQIPSRQREH